jgi:23S rRNA (cytosine1962-C5)-methyltransferase
MAFEPIIAPVSPRRVLQHAEGLLVVDKPHGIPVHGGDEGLRGDLVTRLGDFLEARGEDRYLGVHQRLDEGTSGVMLFTTTRERNAEIARVVERHELGRRYVAVVTLRDGRFAERLARGPVRLEHRLLVEERRSRVVDKGGVVAVSEARLLERSGSRALVELRPETGRTHQLRVQLAHEGAPIAGDLEYGGEPAARLLLHAAELTLGTARLAAPVPASFERFARGKPAALGDDVTLRRSLEDAAILRAPLAAVTDVYRLANDEADELPGVTIDRYGDHAVLHTSSDEAEARASELAEGLVELGARGVYLKVRRRADARRASQDLAPDAPILGEPAPARFLVTERGIRLWVELGRGQSTGLFLDQRENRRRIRELAGGRRVLNLFSYTSSFGVAAAVGGASEVVSVDVAAPALATARDNFRENGIEPASHHFLKDDALDYLARAARRGERYDLIVLDPPSFASSAAGSPFAVSKHYGRAAELALAVLAPGGRLLAVTNHRKTSSGRLRRLLRDAAERARVPVVQLKDLPSQLDCPDGPDGPVPSKSVLLTRR